jgi:hypothetical protein
MAVEPILDGLASYFVVDVDMPMDLGGGNQLETGSYRVSSAILDALPETALTHPPDTFCAVAYGRAQCITTTRFGGHHPTDTTQRIFGPPGGPEIRQEHRPVSSTSAGYYTCDIVRSGHEMRASDGLGYW